mmetsp:Transcript_64385/g.168526  ORF Transcript_64385/g.168526 Transcript_64385/m.168526 type:complete len:237 (+) Transcript_64385:511-1221(+)
MLVPGRPLPQQDEQLVQQLLLHGRAVHPHQPPLLLNTGHPIALEQTLHHLSAGRRRRTHLRVGLLAEGRHETLAQLEGGVRLELGAEQSSIPYGRRFADLRPWRRWKGHRHSYSHAGELRRQEVRQVLRVTLLVKGNVQLLQGPQPGGLQQHLKKLEAGTEIVSAGVEPCKAGKLLQRGRQGAKPVATQVQLRQRHQPLEPWQLEQLVVAEIQGSDARPRARQQLQRELPQVEPEQ